MQMIYFIQGSVFLSFGITKPDLINLEKDSFWKHRVGEPYCI